MRKDIWECKVGFANADDLPSGSDFPMRMAIRDAFVALTGKEPKFLFSGWGGKLTESESRYVETKKGE